eukprot:311556_1
MSLFLRIKKLKRYIAKICDFGVSRKINPNNLKSAASSLNLVDDEKEDEVDDDLDDIADIIDKQQTADLEDVNIMFSEIERTIDVGTPAFLAPEILLKLVKKK